MATRARSRAIWLLTFSEHHVCQRQPRRARQAAPANRKRLLSGRGRRARRLLGLGPVLPPFRAPGRRHAGTIPQDRKNRIRDRKPLQEPRPRAIYHSVRIGARVGRASLVAMSGRTDRPPPAGNGVAQSPPSPGTRRSRGWLSSRNCPPRWSCRAIGATYFAIHLERSRCDGN
jgi:hypothetical protein